MKMSRKIALGLSLAATAVAGAAYAEQAMKGDGVTTRAEAQTRAQDLFARMDANHDGKLDQADRAARRAAVFDRLDADHNGQLSRAEFDAPRGREGADGRGMHRWGGHMAGRHMGHGHGGGMGMGRLADANHDGALTQAEFVGAAMQRFDRADANHDGQVTREERRAAFKAMRDEMRAHRHDRMGAPDTPPPAN